MDERLIEVIEALARADGEIGEKHAYALIDALHLAQEVARLAVKRWQWHQERGRPPGCGWDDAEIRRLYAKHRWLAGPQPGAGTAGVGVEERDVAGLLPDDDAEAGPGAEGEA